MVYFFIAKISSILQFRVAHSLARVPVFNIVTLSPQ